MNEKDVRKVIELQGKLAKLRHRIFQDVEKHNEILMQDLRPLTEGLIHNTIYQIGDMTYKRGKVLCQLNIEDYGLGVKVDGLATLRRIVVGNSDANIDDEESGSSGSVPE